MARSKYGIRISTLVRKLFDSFRWQNLREQDKLLTSLLAVLAGVGVAYAAIGFRQLIYIVQNQMLGSSEENILIHVSTLPWWQIILSTVTGGLVISFIYRFLMNSNRANSIADVMAANAVNHTLIPTKKGLLGAVASAIALGTGSAAGREGPVVHLGATVSSWICQKLHLSPNMSRTVLGCGVAAAVSASFNAPIAGVFFALEVILGQYALSAFAPIVIASVSAAIVSRSSNRANSIADVMAANAVNHTLIPTKKGLLGAVASAIALGTGSAAGREGPVVHLGATVSSWICQKLHLSPNMSRTVLGCGVAAAVSASFNAPIAGVFFALEVILGQYALSAFAPIVIASVSAAIVSRIHIGDNPAFIIPDYYISTFWELPSFIMLGIISAVAAIIFIKCLFITEDFAAKIPIPEWARPPIGGLAIGVLALVSPFILGHGYGTTDGALKELFSFELLLVLIVLKIGASAIALAFRYGTGIFSPSLFLGAMVGGAFGIVASWAATMFGDATFSYGLYAIVGMGAVASAVLGAPISTILIIFELTGDYQITIALMVSVVISNLITQHFLKATSYFHMQLKRDGLDLEGGRARHVMRSTFVRSLMSDKYATALTISRSNACLSQKILPPRSRFPNGRAPPIGGLAIGVLALVSPFILGHGYGTTDGALKELFSFELLLVLIVLKIGASAIALAFRYGTGIFSPSLFLGAMVGGAFGIVASWAATMFGDATFSYGLYAIVGMGAVASAVLGAPISTILIIFELTGDYQITIALMVSVVISNLITQHFLKATSYFHMQLKRDGLDLEGGRARHVMRSTFVRSLMSDKYATALTISSVKHVRNMLLKQNQDNIFILDENEMIVGLVTVAELRSTQTAPKDDTTHRTTASDFCRPVSELLTPSDSLEDAFHKFDMSGEETLPVVTDGSQTEIIGILHQKHVLLAYNKALLEEKE